MTFALYPNLRHPYKQDYQTQNNLLLLDEQQNHEGCIF